MKTAVILAIIAIFGILGYFIFPCNKWDNVFPKNPNVITQKVHFHNRYGIELVGDLYIPKNKTSEKSLLLLYLVHLVLSKNNLLDYTHKKWHLEVLLH